MSRSAARRARRATHVIGRLGVAAAVMVALVGCGTTTTSAGPSSGSATKTEASCESIYVDWLYLSAGVKCQAAKDLAAAIFMGDDGNVRTSFMKEDYAPIPTVKVPGVGYLPTRVLRVWHCGYSTRRSSYGVQTDSPWLEASGSLRFVYATCRLDAGIVKMTTALDDGPNHRDI